MDKKNKQDLALELKEKKELELKEVLTPEVVKKYICKEATDEEIYVFLQIAKSYGLNPFRREIYLVKYAGSPTQFIVGYETYIKRAEDHPQYRGFKCVTEPADAVIPKRAICEVYRSDRKQPFVHSVLFSEFCQYTKEGQANRIWKKQPHSQLKKVVVSQALRLCFPKEFGGLPYIIEEMQEVIEAESKIVESPAVEMPTDNCPEPDKVETVDESNKPEPKKKEAKKSEPEPKKDKAPEAETKPQTSDTVKKPEPQKQPEEVKTYKDLEAKADSMKVPKGKFTLWLMKKLGIKNKKDMTGEQVKEAFEKIEDEFGEKKKENKEDDIRAGLLKKVFALGKDKLGLEANDLRQWVHESYDKGLSEMTAEEIEKVIKDIQES